MPKPANLIAGPQSLAAPHQDVIQAGVDKGLSAQRIWQDLVEQHGYSHGYLTVQRYVRRLKKQHPEVADRMEHPPGEEGQIDFFKSKATVCDPITGRRRRPWVFRLTLSCSKHGYEESLLDQKQLGFLPAHEHAFIELGGVPRVIRMDNTRAAVARACLYDPDLNEIYEAFAKHWGFVPLPRDHVIPKSKASRSGAVDTSTTTRSKAATSRPWTRTISTCAAGIARSPRCASTAALAVRS